jgi:His Kinase A (phospho-acceptor) domain
LQLCQFATSQNGRLASGKPKGIEIVNGQLHDAACPVGLGDTVRYDTMLATALSLDADDAGGRTAQWRQLVDLIVQAKGELSPSMREAALNRIQSLRASVPVDQRRFAATQLASRAANEDGVALFGVDEPAVAAPVLSVAQLDGTLWQQLIPQMPPASRALLRNRRDLPDAAIRVLASYGLADFALPANDAGAGDAGTQIRDLVARIEAFRLGAASAAPGLSGIPAHADEFTFETSTDGCIDWINGVPREALIGISVAEIAEPGGYGVDGQAAGAFRRRAPFRDARLCVGGAGAAAGDWLIAAIPVFNPRDGRFVGYHGSARRPRPDESAKPVAHFAGTTLPVDSLRQLIHELRTPLNAILGFAEMIDRQLLGPATLAYREQAQSIANDGQRLLEMVDDLDQAARVRRDAASAASNAVSDLRAILGRIETGLGPALVAQRTKLTIDAGPPVAVVGVSAAVLERMMTRIIGAAIGLARSGETVAVTLSELPSGQASFSVARPKALQGVSDTILLDPNYDPEMPYPDAPLLGLGFTLRLIEGLARDVGGRFRITADAFDIILPGAFVRADLPAGTP